MIGRRLNLLTVAAAALLGSMDLRGSVEVLPRGPNDYYPDPEPKRKPKPSRFVDEPTRVYRKRRKAEKLARAKIKKAGISGAGLWRKCGGRVRGW